VSCDPAASLRVASEGRPPLGLVVQRGPHSAVVRLSGELDLAVADLLRAALTAARRGAGTVVVDLGELSFMDCAGIGVLVEERRRAEAEGYEVRITGASGEVAELLALTGIDAEPAPGWRPLS
jgi:anti-anti-sigma factor